MMSKNKKSIFPDITIYVVSYNYGKYLKQALESIKNQTFSNWEVILVEDGCDDNSAEIMEEFLNEYNHKTTMLKNKIYKGLRYCANLAIERAKGKYIIRLDADDYFDENALLVMSHYLDKNQDIALVYPNFTYVDNSGRTLAIENRKKLGDEDSLLDLPAHGACTMVRRRVLRCIGGYDESHDAQDGTELWLKVKQRYKVGNISTPLFFYRQHTASLSKDEQRILDSRIKIKKVLANFKEQKIRPKIVGIIPVKNSYSDLPNIALQKIAGRTLIDYTIEEAIASGYCDILMVSTDDSNVIEHCKKYENILTYLRPANLSQTGIGWGEILHDAITYLERVKSTFVDIVTLLSVHSPLRQAKHIQDAIDTLIINNAHSVISVYENMDRQFLHSKNGLKSIKNHFFDDLRFEREVLFTDNNAIKVLWRDILEESNSNYLGEKISHITMPRKDSFQLRSKFDLWIIENILKGVDLSKKTLFQEAIA